MREVSSYYFGWLLLQKRSRFVHGSKLKYYRDDQQTVTNCGARDESIVRESKSLFHNGIRPLEEIELEIIIHRASRRRNAKR